MSRSYGCGAARPRSRSTTRRWSSRTSAASPNGTCRSPTPTAWRWPWPSPWLDAMLPVLTPEEMGGADARAIAGGTPEAVLMERAGRAVAWAVRTRLRGLYGRRAVVVCGKGNNGGDGVIVARIRRHWGARVDEFHLAAGVPRAELARALARADVVVDAMYGTGFRGELEGDAHAVAETLRDFGGAVVAVDIPSGVQGLTGEV